MTLSVTSAILLAPWWACSGPREPAGTSNAEPTPAQYQRGSPAQHESEASRRDDEDALKGKVVSIADGDTLTVLAGTTQHKIRLHGIDCPERKQPFGARAKELTGALAFGKIVSVEVVDRDRYGRSVGIVTLPDGTIVNHALLKAGLAWWYRKYAPNDKTLAKLEATAKKSRIGLWSDASATAPWDWRRGKTSERKSEEKPTASGNYWLNTSSNTRHNSGCRYYQNTKRGRACAPNEGKACGICGG